ncbi:guanine deaminase [Candidatus Rhodobacter oscarellae]|uniref:guanine deaminase n=1 Tax=Candidatus Rhodobacter oscarellae TaxID=1675527 RepID=UPI000A482E36|nr:guanine deaminase [Candidatus Rhodobacter lobularis]
MSQYRADLLHSPERGQIERIPDALVSVDGDGMITSVAQYSAAKTTPDTIDLRGQGVLIPGLVDLHIHAPQFPQLGMALDVPLEDWLLRYTFPLEARYADLDFATEVYGAMVRRLLAGGTTTAVYFATIHAASSLRLAEICVELGQRALVGRVAMDDPESCPEYYRDADAKTAIKDTADFITAVRAIPNNTLVEATVTPRFIPACSDEALAGLGQLAAEMNAPIQTHCSESDWEHHFVHARCGMSDTFALDSFGLLTRRTVLAHAGFIDDDDMDLIRARGAGIAHCPLSNTYFANAAFPLRHALEKSVRVGLGTDISGGPSAFLLDNARAAVATSRMLETGTDPSKEQHSRGVPESRIDFRGAFWLATMGGADVLDLPVGLFAAGRHFDAVLVDLPDTDLVPLSDEDLLQAIVMRATPADLKATWVAGRRVCDDQ